MTRGLIQTPIKAMKKIMWFILIALPLGMWAQPDMEEGEKRNEKVESLKRAYITQELALTPTEAEKFWPVYNAHDEKRHSYKKSAREHMRNLEESGKSAETFNAEVKALTEIRKQEADEDASFLTQVAGIIGYEKAARLPKTEMEFRKILAEEIGKGPGGPGGPGGRPGPPPRGKGPRGRLKK